jgi:hypothetical protein
MPLRKEPASQSQLFCRVTCESESAMLPGKCDLRVRVSYFEADLRVRVSYFEADLRVRVSYFEADLRVRVRGFGGQKATCESESEVLQGHLRVRVSYFAGQPPRAGIPLEVNPAEGCMLGRLWLGGHAPSKMQPCLAKVLPQGVLIMSLRVRVRCFPS